MNLPAMAALRVLRSQPVGCFGQSHHRSLVRCVFIFLLRLSLALALSHMHFLTLTYSHSHIHTHTHSLNLNLSHPLSPSLSLVYLIQAVRFFLPLPSLSHTLSRSPSILTLSLSLQPHSLTLSQHQSPALALSFTVQFLMPLRDGVISDSRHGVSLPFQIAWLTTVLVHSASTKVCSLTPFLSLLPPRCDSLACALILNFDTITAPKLHNLFI